MKITTKVMVTTLGAIAVSVGVGVFIQGRVIRSQGIEQTRETMRAAVLSAENVRAAVSHLNQTKSFDMEKLLAEYKRTGDLKNSELYQTIPVVAAWNSIAEVAKVQGYNFRIPKHQPRNPDNLPTADEAAILKALEDGKTEEYFKVDSQKNEIIYARPIALSADCLTCHGDPKNSATGDGKDLVGLPMENWHVGEVHGAFVLKQSMARLDAVTRAGMTQTLLWVLPLTLAIGFGIFIMCRRVIALRLKEASAAMSAIAAGDLTAELPPSSKDEVGEMLGALSKMVA
jgi:methyl-accepting chemotaxis protein